MLWRSASTRASALPLASFHISCRFSESPGKCCLIEERFGLCEHIGSKVLHHAPMPSFGQASSRLGDERDGPHGNEPLTHRADGSRAAAAKDTGATDDVSQRDRLLGRLRVVPGYFSGASPRLGRRCRARVSRPCR